MRHFIRRLALAIPSRRPAIILVIAVVIAVLGTGSWALRGTSASEYALAHESLHQAIDQARADGYADSDLGAAAVDSLHQNSAVDLPVVPGYYARKVQGARTQIAALERTKAAALQGYREAATGELKHARQVLAQTNAAGVDPSTTNPLGSKLDGAEARIKAASTPKALIDARDQVRSVTADAQGQLDQQAADNAAMQKTADALLAQYKGDPAAIRGAATTALASGRNDGTVADYMQLRAVAPLVAKLERSAAALSSPSAAEVATAAAGVAVQGKRIHDGLITGMPAKAILVSIQGQELWAYEKGQLVQNTKITSGKPPLDTDEGPMKVLRKSSPWKMQSPWPKGSPYYYPPTVVQQVVWFTNTGEGLHDASWQTCCWGPGSQYSSSGSHGCIHVPVPSEHFLFDWAEVGTPVIVYRGDGTPVKDQTAKRSVDSNGQPVSGPKGA